MDTAPHTTEHPLVTSIEHTVPYDDSYEAMVLEYVEKHHTVQYSLLPLEKVAQLYPDDSYEVMVLKLVEEKHITEYGLLPPAPAAVSCIGASPPAIYTSSGSSATESTEIIIIEDASDLPVINPFTLLTEKEMAAITAAHFPPPPPDYEVDDYDWTVALSTYDFLGIEENKHATARARIPWRDINHLQEVKEEMEAFAMWSDECRKRESVKVLTVAVVQTIQEDDLLRDRPRRLFEEAAVETSAAESGYLDGVLEGVQGLGNMAVN